MDIQAFINSGIIEKYVLGIASPEEMDRVEQITKDYPEVNRHICKMQNCMEEYAEMDAIRPRKHLTGQVSAAVENADDVVRPMYPKQVVVYRLPPSWKWGAGLAAMMILTLGVVSWQLYNSQSVALDELALLSTQVKHLQTDQKALQTNNEKITQKYSFLKDVTTQQVHLKGSQNAPQALAVVYWNPSHNKGYLNIVDLPKCPKGHQYQMWANVDGKHLDMGCLKIGKNGSILNSIPYINGSKGFVITMEKEGGSLHPTANKVYALGEI